MTLSKNRWWLLLLPVLFCCLSMKVEWGFFGHRRINRLAVFTLPPEMIVFYKKNIEYISEHAVDPDKRRYATKHEAVRHYIDIDHWGEYPFDEVPRDWIDALMAYTDIYLVNPELDTFRLLGNDLMEFRDGYLYYKTEGAVDLVEDLNSGIKKKDYRKFFLDNIMDQYYEDNWFIDCDSLKNLLKDQKVDWPCYTAFAKDRFSEYGILPYNLVQMQNRLTDAFLEGNLSKILRLSADMGHYVGDAHVPLHTTENYNGQLTNQVGIHAFWESRLPELYADQEYDFFVGKAEYIENPQTFFWDIVLTSHQLLDSLLIIERELSKEFPSDQQYCYEERLGLTVRTQCSDYARAFHERLAGSVEARMRASVHALGSVWYTAWIDAGQPDLENLDAYVLSKKELENMAEQDALFKGGKIQGRTHSN